MESRKRKVLSSEEALRDIEQFIDDGLNDGDSDDDDDDDLYELVDRGEFEEHMRDGLEDIGGDAISTEINDEDGGEMEVLDKVSGERVDIAAAIGFEIVERTQAENVQQREKVKRPKRKLTKYKLVNSLDAALDEENYKELNLSESDTIHVGYLGSCKKMKKHLSSGVRRSQHSREGRTVIMSLQRNQE